MRKKFELEDIHVLSQTRREYETYCVDYGYKAYMHLENLEDIMDVLINGIIAGPRPYWQLLDPTNSSAAERSAKVEEAEEEWDRREIEARRLLMQVYHIHNRIVRMTDESREQLEKYYYRRMEIIDKIYPVFTYALV